MTFSTAAKAALASDSTGEVFVALVKATHADFDGPQRFTTNGEAITHLGEAYLPLPMEVEYPDQDPEATEPTFTITIPDVIATAARNPLLQIIREISDPAPEVEVKLVMASEPDTAQGLTISGIASTVEISDEGVVFTVSAQRLLDLPFGSDRFDATQFPGMFSGSGSS